MSQPLEAYYETELAFVSDFARDFARQFPAEAGRLLPDLCSSLQRVLFWERQKNVNPIPTEESAWRPS